MEDKSVEGKSAEGKSVMDKSVEDIKPQPNVTLSLTTWSLHQ